MTSLITTGKPRPDQRLFLEAKYADYVKLQPGLADLRTRLLTIGGEEIVATHEDDLEKILTRGQLWTTTPKARPGEPSRCHTNSARLHAENGMQIATGWGLTQRDGLWRQHSWAIDKDECLVETTEPRVAYYGYVLTKTEADEFCEYELVI